MSANGTLVDFAVELPAGGFLHLQSADEVRLWRESHERYREDFTLAKQNDLIALGGLLQQQVLLFRYQMLVNGMEPQVDGGGVPTGQYKRVELSAADYNNYMKMMNAVSAEIRAIERSLGIDKATREAGGLHTTDNYIRTLKRVAHQRAVHIAQRTLEYEKIINEVRVRIRLLYFADDEDKKYHGITPKSIFDWLRAECDRLEEVDKTFHREKGKLWLGQL